MKNNSKGFELGKTTELQEHKSYKQKIKKKKKGNQKIYYMFIPFFKITLFQY